MVLLGICADGLSPWADQLSPNLLVAAPGMPVAEMLARSTLKPEGGGGVGVPYVGGGSFDLSVPGTGLTLRQCRYYFIATQRADPTRIESLSIGLASGTIAETGARCGG